MYASKTLAKYVSVLRFFLLQKKKIITQKTELQKLPRNTRNTRNTKLQKMKQRSLADQRK